MEDKKVWVLEYAPMYETGYCLGVYSSQAKAEEAKNWYAYQANSFYLIDEMRIVEHTVDE